MAKILKKTQNKGKTQLDRINYLKQKKTQNKGISAQNRGIFKGG